MVVATKRGRNVLEEQEGVPKTKQKNTPQRSTPSVKGMCWWYRARAILEET
jgi:hypothetical protein